jgi:bifunctional oligoribonuclease and PAP phosphatase NrnA
VIDQVGRARTLIDQASTIVVVSHIRPDGDAIGSLLALTQSLQLRGKTVFPVLADGLPYRFRFLPGAKQVKTSLPETYDILMAVDCADLGRVGFDFPPGAVQINVDHHPTNTNFGEINLVDPAAAATAMVLHNLADELQLTINEDVATNLLTGIVMDTIGFRTSNVTPDVLSAASALMEMGAPLAEIYSRALNRRTFVAAKYWGNGLLRLERENGLVWTLLSSQDRKEIGYEGRDDADLISFLSTIEGAKIVVVLVEQPDQKVKVSWRAVDGFDVSAVAAGFGGGGHKPAAGAMVMGKLEEVAEGVLAVTRGLLSKTVETEQ